MRKDFVNASISEVMIAAASTPLRSGQPGGSPGRRFGFQVVDGPAAALEAGAEKVATIVKISSSQTLLDVEGISVVLDGPAGGRLGKQLLVRVKQLQPPQIEVRPRFENASPGGRATSPESAGRSSTAAAATAGEAASSAPPSPQAPAADLSRSDPATASAQALPSRTGSSQTDPGRSAVQDSTRISTDPGARLPSAASPPSAPQQAGFFSPPNALQGASSSTLRVDPPSGQWTVPYSPAENRATLPAPSQNESALPAIKISESVQGDVRTTLIGVLGQTQRGIRTGEMIPVNALDADSEGVVLLVRGSVVKASQAHGLVPGEIYWAEAIAGSPQPVLRVQSSLSAEARAFASGLVPPKSAWIQSPPANPAAEPFDLPGPVFPKGQRVIAATVQDQLRSGDFAFRSGQQRFSSPAPLGTRVGQDFFVFLEGSQSNSHLRFVPKSEAIPEVLSGLLSNRDAGESTLRLILDELQGLKQASFRVDPRLGQSLGRLEAQIREHVGADSAPSLQRVLRQIENGGLLFESKLAAAANAASDPSRRQEAAAAIQRTRSSDVKGQLLDVLERLQARSDESLIRLGQAVHKHLAHIEARQAVNLLTPNAGPQLFQFELPFLAGGQLTSVEVSIERDSSDSANAGQEDDGEGQAYRILFLLELESLGQTRVEAQVVGKRLQALVYVSERSALPVLQEELAQLQERLAQAGYESAQVELRALQQDRIESKPAPAPSPPDEPDSPQGLIDIVA